MPTIKLESQTKKHQVRETNMSDTETSQSIFDNNGLLITEPANEEPDHEVEDELLQSASEDEDKDIQSPTPPNEPANRLTKKSEQKSSTPFCEREPSKNKERPAKIACHTRTNTRRTFQGGAKCIPPFLITSVDIFALQGILKKCSQLPDSHTKGESYIYFIIFSKM